MKNRYTVIAIMVLFQLGCTQYRENILTEKFYSINVPFDGVDVEVQEYQFDNSDGDSIISKNGHSYFFPSNSIVNEVGIVVEGKIELVIKEYLTPYDHFIGGIPMEMETDSNSYYFESVAMVDIRATKDGKEVFVNPNVKPEIAFVSNNQNLDQNIYLFDKSKGGWVEGSKQKIIPLIKNNKIKNNEREIAKLENEIKNKKVPNRPEMADGQLPLLTLKIDTADFPDVSFYNDFVFEIQPDESTLPPRFWNEQWSSIDVKEGKNQLFDITLKKDAKEKVFKAKIVFEEESFEVAMLVYEKKKVTHQNWVREYEKEVERLRKIQEAKMTQDKATQEVQRRFELTGFGLWNCDAPILKRGIEVKAKYVNEDGLNLDLYLVNMVFKNQNSLLNILDNQLYLIPNEEIMLWAVKDSTFYYLGYEEYKESESSVMNGEIVLKMNRAVVNIESVEDLKSVLGIENSWD